MKREKQMAAPHAPETQSKIKAFYHLLVNSSLAAVLNYTVWFAITFFVYIQTQSVFATAIIAGIFLVSIALTGIWFGSIVDHHRKKQVMIWSSWASLAAYLVAFGLYMTFPESAYKHVDSVPLWALIITLMAGVLAGNLRGIALPTTVTLLIPEADRDKANGLSGTAMGLAMLVTSVISGVLVGLAGMLYVLILAIVGMFGIIAYLMAISVPEPKIVHNPDAPKQVDIKGTLAVIGKIPGLYALILFTTFNNFLGGVFMSLMDAYGLSLVSVQVWGFLWGFLSLGFIVGGMIIAKKGLGKNPLKALLLANMIIWAISCVFTIQPSIILLTIGTFIYMAVMPFIEAAEQTVLQKVVPPERQGRVFGFAQSVEQAASPLTAFMIGPIAQFIAIPFMTTGAGAELIGSWFGTGQNRGIALIFTISGIIGLITTILALSSNFYRKLSKAYLEHPSAEQPQSS
jgi:DHA3 family multidrug efflux protein-like MFS transporter